jgi:hypothetical protein
MANSKAALRADAKRTARITALFERIARSGTLSRRPITLAPVSILAASATNVVKSHA